MTNYFEFYDIPTSLNPDAVTIKNKYYELSRKYHPDRYAQADTASKTDMLRMAALNNEAYKTLSNPDRTIAYILKLNNLLEEEEKYSLPPDFLMEMMNLNEIVSECEENANDPAYKGPAINMIQNQFSEWESGIAPLSAKFNGGNHSKELLMQIKDYYFRKKYLLRIQQRINTFAAR